MSTIKAIRFSEEEIANINKYAQEKGISYSKVVRQAIKEFFASKSQENMTVYKVVELSKKDENIDLLYGQFLDDFARSTNKSSCIEKEPNWPTGDNGIWPYLLAATAHKLAHENSISVPKWALSEKYISPKPIYGMNTKDPDFKKYLENTSPMEFKSHNLFFGENILSRY